MDINELFCQFPERFELIKDSHNFTIKLPFGCLPSIIPTRLGDRYNLINFIEDSENEKYCLFYSVRDV